MESVSGLQVLWPYHGFPGTSSILHSGIPLISPMETHYMIRSCRNRRMQIPARGTQGTLYLSSIWDPRSNSSKMHSEQNDTITSHYCRGPHSTMRQKRNRSQVWEHTKVIPKKPSLKICMHRRFMLNLVPTLAVAVMHTRSHCIQNENNIGEKEKRARQWPKPVKRAEQQLSAPFHRRLSPCCCCQ